MAGRPAGLTPGGRKRKEGAPCGRARRGKSAGTQAEDAKAMKEQYLSHLAGDGIV